MIVCINHVILDERKELACASGTVDTTLLTTNITGWTSRMIPTQRTAARSLGRIRVQAATQAPMVVHAHNTPGRTGQARALASTWNTPSETRRLARPITVSTHRGLATAAPSEYTASHPISHVMTSVRPQIPPRSRGSLISTRYSSPTGVFVLVTHARSLMRSGARLQGRNRMSRDPDGQEVGNQDRGGV